jgi:hypothetical protein
MIRQGDRFQRLEEEMVVAYFNAVSRYYPELKKCA